MRIDLIEGMWVWFRANGILPGQKTERWNVESKGDGSTIGHVKWYGPWRKYAFFPTTAGTVYEQVCLRDIAQFIEDRTSERKLAG